jgi:dephospho-CoA kinase
MEPRVEVEVIRVPSKRERRLARLAQQARDANEIARARNARTKANREKYANNNSTDQRV